MEQSIPKSKKSIDRKRRSRQNKIYNWHPENPHKPRNKSKITMRYLESFNSLNLYSLYTINCIKHSTLHPRRTKKSRTLAPTKY